jgi:hypothetical protein
MHHRNSCVHFQGDGPVVKVAPHIDVYAQAAKASSVKV